jgi:two-component system chemotaxis sensor kinase CheA
MEEFKQGFIEEALQLVEKLEEILLNLNTDEVSNDNIQEIFRVMHTIKGSAAMFGFANTEKITHKLEDVYDLIRDNKLVINEEIITQTIQTVDVAKTLLNNDDELNDDIREQYNLIISAVSNILGKSGTPITEQEPEDEGVFHQIEKGAPDKKSSYFYIYFKPDNDILQRGIAPVNVFEELLDYGKITGFPYIEDVPSPEEYDPASFFLAWDIFIKTESDKDDIEDCFLFYLEHEYKVIEIQPDKLATNEAFISTCIHLNKGELKLEQIIDRLGDISDIAITEGKTKTIEKVKEGELIRPAAFDNAKNIESIKVDSKKLDELINLVSELVTLNSKLEIQTAHLKNDSIKKTIKSVSKLSKRFRDNALDLRLIPVKVLILKLQRLVRDLSKTLGKEIEFITEGTHTELDKNIIAKLEGPLMHILRNSLDHGIESTENRIKAGKPKKGVIRFIAFYSGSNVFIQIQDDGRGIDIEKVKHKAIEKGIIEKGDPIEKQDVFNLLFAPGFSTANSVSSVSGRGVGLDVVKKEISDMRGEIDIESEKGLGTSFTLKLPLTLSIIDTLRVMVDGVHILIPREFIVQTSLQIRGSDKLFEDKYEFENKILPVISLRNDFNENLEQLNKNYIVIVKQYDKMYALEVDNIIGEHQAVVKPLGYYNHDHDYFSGASILGDGSLALILDVNKVISIKKNKKSVGNYNLK